MVRPASLITISGDTLVVRNTLGRVRVVVLSGLPDVQHELYVRFRQDGLSESAALQAAYLLEPA